MDRAFGASDLECGDSFAALDVLHGPAEGENHPRRRSIAPQGKACTHWGDGPLGRASDLECGDSFAALDFLVGAAAGENHPRRPGAALHGKSCTNGGSRPSKTDRPPADPARAGQPGPASLPPPRRHVPAPTRRPVRARPTPREWAPRLEGPSCAPPATPPRAPAASAPATPSPPERAGPRTGVPPRPPPHTRPWTPARVRPGAPAPRGQPPACTPSRGRTLYGPRTGRGAAPPARRPPRRVATAPSPRRPLPP